MVLYHCAGKHDGGNPTNRNVKLPVTVIYNCKKIAIFPFFEGLKMPLKIGVWSQNFSCELMVTKRNTVQIFEAKLLFSDAFCDPRKMGK